MRKKPAHGTLTPQTLTAGEQLREHAGISASQTHDPQTPESGAPVRSEMLGRWTGHGTLRKTPP
eukprot:6212384-Pleurochrysis_carterae.AAC.3